MTISQAQSPSRIPSSHSSIIASPTSQRMGAVVRQEASQQDSTLPLVLRSKVNGMVEKLNAQSQEGFSEAFKDYAQAIEENITGKDDPNIKELAAYIGQKTLPLLPDEEQGEEAAPLLSEDNLQQLEKFRLLTVPLKKILTDKTFCEEVFKGLLKSPENLNDPKFKTWLGLSAVGVAMAASTNITSPKDTVSRLSSNANTLINPALLWKTVLNDKLSYGNFMHKALFSIIPEAIVSFGISPLYGNAKPNTALGVGVGTGIYLGLKALEKAPDLYKKLKNSASEVGQEPVEQASQDAFMRSIIENPDNPKFFGQDAETQNNVLAKSGIGIAILAAKIYMMNWIVEQGFGNATMTSFARSTASSLGSLIEHPKNENVSAQDMAALGGKGLIAAGLLLGFNEKISEDNKENMGVLIGSSLLIAGLTTLTALSLGPTVKRGVAAVKKESYYAASAQQYQEKIQKISEPQEMG